MKPDLSDLSSLGTFCHALFDRILSPGGFFCQDATGDAIIDGTRPPLPSDHFSSVAMGRLNEWLELGVADLCLLGAIGLGIYYCEYNRKRRRHWTTQQTNTCLLPLAVSATFAVIFYLTR